MPTERAFIHCSWRESTQDLSSRLETIATALETPAVLAAIGSGWFRTAGSRARALNSPLALNEIRHIENWSRRRRLPHQPFLTVDLWNGKDGLDGMKLNVSIHLFDGKPDVATLAPFRLCVDGAQEDWRSLQHAARVLAEVLHGMVVLSSHELVARAVAVRYRAPVLVGYAFYFGPSNPMLPCFAQLEASGISAPREFVIAEPGAEIGPVELERLDELAKCTGLW